MQVEISADLSIYDHVCFTHYVMIRHPSSDHHLHRASTSLPHPLISLAPTRSSPPLDTISGLRSSSSSHQDLPRQVPPYQPDYPP
ncbi:hypothetical protein [Absidia glauca]|uniref:Uncharacterized protein n=1 Tax=Absidia glauca TaxID=4829 RepID=A0A163JD43_ABSGL|nr:hypothetical protein [Absidia glauca]